METAYVMLTGDDGVPKVLSSLCLHCQNGQLVCGYSWLCQPAVLWRRTDVFPVTASSGRLALHGHVSTTNAPVDSGGGEWRGMWPFLSDLYQHLCVSLM